MDQSQFPHERDDNHVNCICKREMPMFFRSASYGHKSRVVCSNCICCCCYILGINAYVNGQWFCRCQICEKCESNGCFRKDNFCFG